MNSFKNIYYHYNTIIKLLLLIIIIDARQRLRYFNKHSELKRTTLRELRV